jgi:hypothetical protein
MIIFRDGRTPRTSDQLVARPLSKHRTTQTQNKHIHTQNIHALCGIRTHDPGFRASEDSSCFRPLGYRDRLQLLLVKVNSHVAHHTSKELLLVLIKVIYKLPWRAIKNLRNLIPKLNSALQYLYDNIFCTPGTKNCHLGSQNTL